MAALQDKYQSDGRMSLGEHLPGLRRRVLVAAEAIAVGSVLGWVGLFYAAVGVSTLLDRRLMRLSPNGPKVGDDGASRL